MGGKFMKLLIKITTLFFFVVTLPFTANALDINFPGFSGSVNTTLTSGFSIRTEDNNCLGLPGYNTAASTDTVSATAAGLIAAGRTPTNAAAMDSIVAASVANQSSKNGAGCSKSLTDGYGNTSIDPLNIGNQNADDGKMNFPDSGDFINATSKMLTEIEGYSDGGTGITLSFIGSVNPVLDINGPQFRELTSKAKDELEQDITLLDAYITQSIDLPGGDYVDLTFGRLATSYGEATFLPIGMNGLVTSGIDLSKLRNPGASIKDAIIPTEQLVASFQAGDWGVEAYYQFGHDPVKLDPKGAFYGSDVASTGAKNLLASGGWQEGTYGTDMACSYAYNVLQLAAGNAAASSCNLASYTQHRDNEIYDTSYLARYAAVNASTVEWQTWAGAGRGTDWQSAIQKGGSSFALPGLDLQDALATHTSTAATAQTLAANVYTDANIVPWDQNSGATVAVGFHSDRFKDPDGQDFGFSAHKYFEDIGSGVDIGLYFANYTSKAPYASVIGEGGVLAGDHVGMYMTQYADYLGLDGTAGHSSGHDVVQAGGPTLLTTGNITASGAAWLAMANGTYSSGVAGGFMSINGAFDALRKDGGNTADAANSTVNEFAKNYIKEGLYGNGVTHTDGTTKVYHSPVGLVTGFATAFADKSTAGQTSTTDLAFLGYAGTLLPAIVPINYSQIQFIYPENTILGASFNTNVNSTTVQGEVSYRPDFKLATGLGDQVNQISDAAGSSLALTLFGIESGQTTMHDAVLWQSLEGVVNTVGGGDFTMLSLVQGIERSSLPNLTAQATAASQADYRSSAFIEYDTWSVDVGTTTLFSPSSQLAQGLGADSAVLLTELGAVYIAGMDNKRNGFVARNGFNEGSGEYLCLGIFQDLSAAQRAAISTNMKALGYTNFNIDHNMMEVSTYTKRATSNSSHTRGGVALAAGTLLEEGDIALGTSSNTTITAAGTGTNSLDKITKISSVTNIGAGIIDALFGNGSYCESQMGADELSMTYRLIGSATYNNIYNSRWSMSPNFAWAHDFYGYGPSSLGGFVPGKQSLSLGLNLDKGDGLRVGLSYVMQMGDLVDNMSEDRDFVSANVSYAF